MPDIAGAVLDDGIRPMTLASIPETSGCGTEHSPLLEGADSETEAGSGVATMSSSGSGGGGGGGSSVGGGGGGGYGQDPILSPGSCSPGLDGQSPNYRIDNGVPVGSILSYFVVPPYGHWTVIAATWTGGTNYVDYYKGPSTAVPPQQMEVTKDPNNGNGTLYQFIVDPMPRQYTITVNAVYEDGSEGSATLTFTSYAPTITFDTIDQGQPRLRLNPDPSRPDGGSADIVLDDDPATQDWPQNAGMHIVATATTQQFGGEFMFLQLIAPARFTVVVSGAEYRLTLPDKDDPDNPGQKKPSWAVDNAFVAPGFNNPHPGAIGYVMVYRDNAADPHPEAGNSNRTDWNAWELAPNSSETFQMGDSPFARTPLNS